MRGEAQARSARPHASETADTPNSDIAREVRRPRVSARLSEADGYCFARRAGTTRPRNKTRVDDAAPVNCRAAKTSRSP